MARISLRTFHETSNGTTTITIHNVSLGGIKGTTEERVLDGEFAEHSDYIWGHVKGRTQYALTQDTNDNLMEHWSQETSEGECIVDETMAMNGSWSSIMVSFIMSSVIARPAAFSDMLIPPKIWGFEMINGSRFFVRHVTVRRGSQSSSARLVYEYTGPTS